MILHFFRSRPLLFRSFAALIGLSFLAQILTPVAAFASGGGSTQPEFTDFEPVGSPTGVNPFTGGFTYNLPVLEIPGPEGAGYALSLSYHSGLAPGAESSWVGYGWTLNPGAVTRNKRGYPDDVKEYPVTKHNRMPASQTFSLSGKISAELFSLDDDDPKSGGLNAGANATISYNNYSGFAVQVGAGLDFLGGIGISGATGTAGSSWESYLNPTKLLSPLRKAAKEQLIRDKKNGDAWKLSSLALRLFGMASGTMNASYSFYPYALNPMPVNVSSYSGFTATGKIRGQLNISGLPAGIQGGLSFSYANRKKKEISEKKAYGYMYSGEAGASDLMDYSTERVQEWSKQDHFLGIPQSAADQFSILGEGLSGSIRLYQKNVGHFRPNWSISRMGTPLSVGIEISGGGNIGAGSDISDFGSYSIAQSGDLKDKGNTTQWAFGTGGDENVHFRFLSDPAASVSFGDDLSPEQARFEPKSSVNVPGFKRFEPILPSNLAKSAQNLANPDNDRIDRSSYVGFHTNREMVQASASGRLGRAYERRSYTSFLDRMETDILDGIGEVAVSNTSGSRYVYGLPVFSRDEAALQYKIREKDLNLALSDNDEVILSSTFNEEKAHRKFGTESPQPYASTYLLTQINTPDYVDLEYDGPTEDDLGGYVSFDYDRAFGGTNKTDDIGASGSGWYHWRNPWCGMSFEPGTNSSARDNLGSFASGEKEVYYLKKIETKTHIAHFYTSDRLDGNEAHSDDISAGRGVAPTIGNRLQKLDSIKVYRRLPGGANGPLLKTTHFRYDYSLMPDQPNSDAPGAGKLTLKKVWFEDFDRVSARVSPYEFHYEYPRSSDYAPEVRARYPEIVNHADALALSEENVPYDNRNIDRWGFYRKDGATRSAALNPWVDQVDDGSSGNWDPAAWHLKKVVLPSDGEIHVQYEQNRYRYVQNRPAMAMVPLLGGGTIDPRKFFLDVSAIGVDPGNRAELEQLAAHINQVLLEGENPEPIYFKFLYSLVGSPASIGKCNSEYIDGYSLIKEAGVDSADRLYIELAEPDPKTAGRNLIPQSICKDYVRTVKGGVINIAPDGDCGFELLEDLGTEEVDDFDTDVAETIATKILQFLFMDIYNLEHACETLNEDNSYFRIPVCRDKLGGGVRVKRLLRYDPGMEIGGANLYGEEFSYEQIENQRKVSSGVASYEPGIGREENSLVSLLPRDPQNWAERIFAGRDKEQNEGPLGEYFYPSPSVGYAKVEASNIHKGLSSSGFVISEYFTAKDYPTKVAYTEIDDSRKDVFKMGALMYNRNVRKHWLSQGYTVLTNDMHGQPKATYNYSGQADRPETWGLTSSKRFEYYDPGEQVQLVNPQGDTLLGCLGKSTEIIAESRQFRTEEISNAIEFDATIGFFGPFVVPFTVPILIHSQYVGQVASHVINKHNHFAPLLKSSEENSSGMITSSSIEVFDALTGEAVVSTRSGQYAYQARPYNKYRDYAVRAANRYPEMGNRSVNENRIVESDPARVRIDLEVQASGQAFLVFTAAGGADACDAMSHFFPGDLIRIDGIYYYHLGEKNENKIPAYASKTLGAYPATISTYSDKNVHIIRSGRSNQLTTAVASLTTYGLEDPELAAAGPGGTPLFNLMQTLNSILSSTSPPPVISIDLSDPAYAGLEVASYDVHGNCTLLPYNPAGKFLNLDFTATSPPYRAYAGIGATPGPDFSQCNPSLLSFAPPAGGYSQWGEFRIGEDGNLYFFSADNSCHPQLIACLERCPQYSHTAYKNVIAASAFTFDDNWDYENDAFGLSPYAFHNDYETGKKGKWRPWQTWAYEVGISTSGDSPDPNNFESGIYDQFYAFDHQHLAANDSNYWVAGSHVGQYSPHGLQMQSKDALNIARTSGFGYNDKLPLFTAENANPDQVIFESFENNEDRGGTWYFDNQIVDLSGGSARSTSWAHAGTASYFAGRLSGSGAALPFTLPLRTMDIDPHIAEKGLLAYMWVRQDKGSGSANYVAIDDVFRLHAQTASLTLYSDFKKVSRVGDWTLLKAEITDLHLALAYGSSSDLWLGAQGPVTSGPQNGFWIDDLRIQPTDAAMSCFVYDPVLLRPVASFDDQHFSMYYGYDAGGRLTRKMIETEEGLKTVSDAHYHTIEQKR